MTDERRSKPSASYIPLYSLCHGAYLLAKQVPESERRANKDMDIGTRVHAANETGDLSELESLTEEDIVRRIRQREEEIFNTWVEEFGITDAEIRREKRLWMRDVCSGKLDFLAHSKNHHRALIIDAKSGRKAVTETPRNLQLRTQAVLAATNFTTVEGIRVAIAQPFAKTQPVVDYTGEDQAAAWKELIGLLHAINDPKAPRTPGDHCGHCAALGICPEARAVMLEIADLKNLAWSSLPKERRVELWEKSKLAEKIGKQIASNVRSELTADPDAYAGLLVKQPDTKPRVITEAIKAYSAFANEFPELTPDELQAKFNEWTEVSIGAMQTFYREQRGGTADAAKEWFNRTMKDCLGVTTRSGSVVKVKAA